MNNWKSILYFGIGVIAGAVGGTFGTRNYFKKKYSEVADRQINDMENYYNRTDEYARLEISEEDEEVNPTQNADRSKGPLGKDARDDIKKKLERNWQGTTNYAAMYNQKKQEEEEATDETEESEEDPGKEWTEQHKKERNRPPRIISQEEASDLEPRFESEVLYYYTVNDVLVDDYENVVDEPARLIGDALTKYDFVNSDETIIYVLNYELSICYEIQKWDDEYNPE